MSVPGPTLGPCQSWIDATDVAACEPCAGLGTAFVDLLDIAAVEASMALYELSGRRFSGSCEWTVRPCRTQGDCWDWSPQLPSPSLWWGGVGGIWGWRRDEGGPLCGCAPLSVVKLSGYPVREILEVKIDGVVLDALDDNGNPNYRLDHWRDLVRMDDPTQPMPRRFWPPCQNLALNDTEAGTFSVTYTWGIDPPELGRRAAAQLACQLMLSCSTDAEGNCVLPSGVTRIERAGITVDRTLLLAFLDPARATGITSLDLFVGSYVGKGMVGRRAPAVYSPDVQTHARRLGG